MPANLTSTPGVKAANVFIQQLLFYATHVLHYVNWHTPIFLVVYSIVCIHVVMIKFSLYSGFLPIRSSVFRYFYLECYFNY